MKKIFINVGLISFPKNGVFAIHINYLYSKNTVWDELYEKAKNIRDSREISGMICAGGVGAAILRKNHNIYTGVCIDTASSLGMCAKRNAIANMITNGKNEIEKLVCIDSKGNVGIHFLLGIMSIKLNFIYENIT